MFKRILIALLTALLTIFGKTEAIAEQEPKKEMQYSPDFYEDSELLPPICTFTED